MVLVLLIHDVVVTIPLNKIADRSLKSKARYVFLLVPRNIVFVSKVVQISPSLPETLSRVLLRRWAWGLSVAVSVRLIPVYGGAVSLPSSPAGKP